MVLCDKEGKTALHWTANNANPTTAAAILVSCVTVYEQLVWCIGRKGLRSIEQPSTLCVGRVQYSCWLYVKGGDREEG